MFTVVYKLRSGEFDLVPRVSLLLAPWRKERERERLSLAPERPWEQGWSVFAGQVGHGSISSQKTEECKYQMNSGNLLVQSLYVTYL